MITNELQRLGDCDIIYRNSSNGYYGGSISWESGAVVADALRPVGYSGPVDAVIAFQKVL